MSAPRYSPALTPTLRWCLGVGYLLPSAVSVTCKSGQTRPQGPERACSEGLLRVQWIEQIPSKSGKIFLDPLVLVLHPFFTMCHLMHSSNLAATGPAPNQPRDHHLLSRTIIASAA